MSNPLVDRLAELDACAVSDALDQLGLAGQVALGLAALAAGRRIAGRVQTVQLGPDDGRPKKRHLCTAVVDASGAGDVIAIAHEAQLDVAGWGGTLAKGAKRNGVEGVVIDGACRDVDESRDYDLPLYGRVGVPTTARGRIIEYDWNVPVKIAGVAVAPGDLVIADGSGVVFVPQARAEAVLQAAEAIAAKERLMAQEVDRGKPMSEVMGADYENMLKEQRS